MCYLLTCKTSCVFTMLVTPNLRNYTSQKYEISKPLKMYFSSSSHHLFSLKFKRSQRPNLKHINHILALEQETKFHTSVGPMHVSEKLLPITLECLRKITKT